MTSCRLCPRQCGVDRNTVRGVCRMGSEAVVARAAPHFGEEPCISGEKGSGTVFFAGCTLRCVFCQNHEISWSAAAMDYANRAETITPEELVELAIRYRSRGNIGLDALLNETPGQIYERSWKILDAAKRMGRKHILAASDYMFYGTKTENVHAMCRAVSDFNAQA